MENGSADRLTPEVWIEAAYAAFEDGGIEAVRVDTLAKGMGITRGSFYWHFKNRRELLHAVVDRWRCTETENVIEANEAAGGTSSERLLRLLRNCSEDDGRFEIGVRAWAKNDALARETVARVDESRIAYMTQLAQDIGLVETEARARARIAYLAWLGIYMDAVPSQTEQRRADMDQLWRMMIRRLSD